MWVTLGLLLIAAFAAVLVAALLAGRRARARQLYQQRLERALEDGILTAEEVAELDSIREEKELTQAEVRMVARAIYKGALRDAVEDARLTTEEDEALERLRSQLGLSEDEVGGRDQVQVSRLRLLGRVQSGELPRVDAPITLVPHEVCHWVVQSSLAERLALPRPAREAPRAIALAVVGDAPFDASAERDALRPREEILPTDLGVLIVTSRRTIFQGAKHTISVPHARLDTIALYGDALHLDEAGGTPGGFLLVEDAELTAAILLHAARQRRREIRPSRTGRSA